MKKMYFRYGNGKSADLCQTAYNYREGGAEIVILNADGDKKITSKVTQNDESILSVDPTDAANEYLFEQGFRFKAKNVSAILVDNAHMLSVNQVEQLYYLSKTFDITVIAYGNRTDEKGNIPEASLRLMELANYIEKVDGEIEHKIPLVFYYGTMNSSKTAKLLYKAFDLEKQGLKVVTVKPSVDRDARMIKSRIGLEREASIVLTRDSNLLTHDFRGVQYVLVDEAQFLTTDQIDSLKLINEHMQIPVLCYGLKSDFLTKAFVGSKRLLAIAELKKMRTICKCADKVGASFNARRYKDGDYIVNGPQVVVDNSDKVVYESLCDGCYIRDVQGIDLRDPEKVLKNLIQKNIVKY